ncbi:MAG: aminotransferase class III-fold pyridoxal phosphate-dependent enzyme [Bacteroidales bacterium]|nr:aminotransferase class III-fold pyridoxal phosphate-dependent enzyme [Bacteroidales bacterium]
MGNIMWSTGHDLLNREIIRGKNCHVFDKQGNSYLDIESGTWSTVIGHCHPAINQVLIEQASQLIHTGFNYYHPIIEEVSGQILKLVDMPEGKCVFLCSGSEAIEYGVRVIRSIIPNSFLLTFNDTYCGAYGSASIKDKRDWILYDWHNCSCTKAGKECEGDCKEFEEIPFTQISGFVFEPGSSAGLVKFPSIRLIQKIVENIRKNIGYILVNEVTTGIGRTGKWFGYQHYGIHPDLVALGKGLGNGYPVSSLAMTKRTHQNLKNKEFIYAQSHQNDALGAAVAGAVIKTIQTEGLIERCITLEDKIRVELAALSEKYPLIRKIRGRGLMIAIEFEDRASYIHNQLFQHGIFCAKRRGHEVLRIDPPLTIEHKDIEQFIFHLDDILSKMKAASSFSNE